MSRRRHPVCALVIVMIGLIVSTAQLAPTVLAEQRDPRIPASDAEYTFVVERDNDTLMLDLAAPPPPASLGQHFQHFGTYFSATQTFAAVFQTLQLDYTPTNPGDGLVLVDLRASLDGTRWSEWELDHRAGETIRFASPARYAQYRIKLFGNQAAVGVQQVRLTPRGSVDFTALDTPPIAPTYKVHATRMGMVGGRTANGHIITSRDHYVSLPSWRSLTKRGGNEYMVRITYNGRTSVAPVWDVGPWNVHDDFWNKDRERFSDLPRGYPQDHAAYFDGYNKGIAEKGRVSFPTAVDVGDGVWFDDLKIKGDRAVIEITFLWLGSDPQADQPPPAPTAASTAAPTAAPTVVPTAAPTAVPTTAPTVAPTAAPPEAPTPTPVVPSTAPTEAPTVAPTAVPAVAATPAEVTVAIDSPMFKKMQAKVWYDAPKECASSRAHWTYTTPNPKEGENTARWQPTLPADGVYELLVYVPNCTAKKARTTSAHYLVKHRDGQAEVVINQEAKGGQWVSLGRYPFASGEGAFIELRDITDDAMQVVWYDAAKWVPVK